MLIRLLLLPLSFAYLMLGLLRHLVFTTIHGLRYSSAIPVICLGNISAGGSGKTPLGLQLAKELSTTKKVGVLLRGYKSRSQEHRPLLVNKTHSALAIGDEAKLYRDQLEDKNLVVISPNRKEGIEQLQKEGAEVVIMDDGLQHLKVKPSVAVCVIEVSDLEKINFPRTKYILPSGRLREWPSLTLSRADVVVFTKKLPITDLDREEITKCINKYKINKYISVELRSKSLYDGFNGNTIDTNEPLSGSFFSSVARPFLVKKNLENLNITLTNKCIFSDHKPILKSDWAKVLKDTVYPIFCTEKDLVKIKEYIKAPGEVFVLKQSTVEVEPKNMTTEELLAEAINS